MYAGSPTIFNVPEITTLRRVKPLPKRRRTSAHEPSLMASSAVPVMASPLGAAAAAAAAAVVASSRSLISDAELETAANALLAPLPPPSLPPAHLPSAPQQLLQAQPLALTSQVQSLSMPLLPSSSNTTRTVPPRPQALHPPQSTAVNLDTDNDRHLLSDSCSNDGTRAEEAEEELLARADSLSARMTLQSYYMPMLGSVQEFLAAAAASAGISAGEMFKDRLGGTTTNTTATTGDGMGPYVDLESTEFLYGPGAGYHGMSMGMGFGGLGMGMGGGDHHEEDDSYGDGDYVNHLQQPGNTKKRKVPANVSVSQRDDADSSDHTQDEGEERDVHFGRAVDYDDVESSSPSCLDRLGYPHLNYGYQQVSPHASMVPTLYHGAKRGKLTAVTLAGLQHKEMLKTRKRQLAAVLGALSHGDTLALDQALSMSYVNPGTTEHHTPKIRLSKRKVVKMARMAGKKGKENQNPNRKQKFPICEFTFVCPSATADRLIATKEEVKVLRSKFEAELARQAEQLAAANTIIKAGSDESLVRQPLVQVVPPQQSTMGAMTVGQAKGSKGKKGRTKSLKTVVTPEAVVATAPPETASPTKSSRGKKKKRSALANESNPHHLKNYVPSRLAQSSSYNASHTHNSHQQQQQQSWVSPLPVQFLSAEIPPRRRRSKNGEPIITPTTQAPLMEPADEWICAFCEYDLFYGDDVRFRRAVRNRKKILKRRRRARERAAAAASGRGAGTSVPVTNLAPNAGGNAPPVPLAPVSPNCSDGSGPPVAVRQCG